MVHRLALLLGGVASVGVIVFAVAGSGLFAAAPASAVDQPAPAASITSGSGSGLFAAAPASAVDQPAPAASITSGSGGGMDKEQSLDTEAGPTRIVVDKVYIAPTPPPEVIQVRNHTAAQLPTNDTTSSTPPRASRDDQSDSESEQEPADDEGGSGEHQDSGRSERADD